MPVETSSPTKRAPYWIVLATIAVAISLLISRRPDALLHPQFYGEDGVIWYAQAHNYGWLQSLIAPDGGYLNTWPRLIAGLCLLFPLKYVPLVMTLFGLACQVLPAALLLSPRFSGWGPLWMRLAQAMLYIAMPNAREIYVVLTNAQWHLALALVLIALADPPPTRSWKLFDIGVTLVSGLTGPFCIVLLPVTLIWFFIRRNPHTKLISILLAVCAAVQGAYLIAQSGDHPRLTATLGATPEAFFRIVGGLIFHDTLFGADLFGRTAALWKPVLFAIGGAAVLFYVAMRAHWRLRLFILFSVLLLAASLKSPLVAGPLPRWQLLERIPGDRYWFFPVLAFLWSVLWLVARAPGNFNRALGTFLLALVLIGIRRDWVYPPFQDTGFQQCVRNYETAQPGTWVRINVYPPGAHFRLLKR